MTLVTFKYPAGICAEDKNSGIQGVISSRLQRLNGCLQYCIQPKAKEGATEPPDGFYTDEQNLKSIDDSPLPVVNETYVFQYETGDRVQSLLTKSSGIITIRFIDMNLCERYLFVLPELNKEFKEIGLNAFPQEIKFLDKGLNTRGQPVKRERTGGPHATFGRIPHK